jgi:hypothetical protein
MDINCLDCDDTHCSSKCDYDSSLNLCIVCKDKPYCKSHVYRFVFRKCLRCNNTVCSECVFYGAGSNPSINYFNDFDDDNNSNYESSSEDDEKDDNYYDDDMTEFDDDGDAILPYRGKPVLQCKYCVN